MHNILNYILKEFPNASDTFDGDKELMIFSVLGVLEIAIFFIVMGCVSIFFLDKTMPKEAYLERKRVTQIFGFALLSCGISRVFDIIALWHNYAVLNAIFRNLTGLFAMAALVYIPFVIRAVKKIRTLDDIHTTMKKTSEKVEELSQISRDVIQKIK